MSKIKTYQQIGKEEHALNFEISKLEDIYTRRNGKPDTPHRHDFYTVIIANNANGKHFIDFNEHPFHSNQIYFVNPGQVHQLIEVEKSYGYGILFSTQFLINNNIPISFIDDLHLFNDYGFSDALVLDLGQMKIINQFCEQLIQFSLSTIKFKEQAIGATLKLLLIQCNNVCTLPNDNPQIIDAAYSILKKFKATVEANYTEWHSSSQYAAHLNITPDHLNKTIKSLIGKTAKEYIQSRISTAAKRLLYFSDLSTKEIAYQLGFSEASNFSAFFKKCTKQSPSNFRKNK